MIRVLFQLNQLGYGGTEKAILTFIKNIDRSMFEPWVYYNLGCSRLNEIKIRSLRFFSDHYKSKHREKFLLHTARLHDFDRDLKGNLVIGRDFKDFISVIKRICPQIIHFNRGLPVDFYTENIREVPKEIRIVETNIFATIPTNLEYAKRLSKSLFVSNWCLQRVGAIPFPSGVLYNPVDSSPRCLKTTIREELNIPKESFVIGRLSRPDLDDGNFVFEIIKTLHSRNKDIVLLTIGASSDFINRTRSLNYVHNLPPTTDNAEINKFLSGLDTFLHYRAEGETFGLNVAEAMFNGIPTVTHMSNVDNAQIELVSKYRLCGLIVTEVSVAAYVKTIEELLYSPTLRKLYGDNARTTAVEQFDSSKLTRKLEEVYNEVITS